VKVIREIEKLDTGRHLVSLSVIESGKGITIVAAEDAPDDWKLLVACGRPGTMRVLRRGEPDLAACETWARWVGEQVLVKGRTPEAVFADMARDRGEDAEHQH